MIQSFLQSSANSRQHTININETIICIKSSEQAIYNFSNFSSLQFQPMFLPSTYTTFFDFNTVCTSTCGRIYKPHHTCLNHKSCRERNSQGMKNLYSHNSLRQSKASLHYYIAGLAVVG